MHKKTHIDFVVIQSSNQPDMRDLSVSTSIGSSRAPPRLKSIALLLVISPVITLAQTAPPPSPSTSQGDTLGEIIVTAQKREQNLQDVGLSVNVLSSTELAEKHINSLQDIAQAVPGLVYTQSQTATPVYTLRGVGFYESSLAAYPRRCNVYRSSPVALAGHLDLDSLRSGAG